MEKTINKPKIQLPETVWDELAEYDLLMEYIEEFLADKLETNTELKSIMYEAIYQNYKSVCPQAEIYYANKFIDSIQFFLDGIKNGKIQSDKS